MRRICPHEERYVRPTYNGQRHGAKTVGKGEQESFPDAVVSIIILRTELQDRKEENKRLVKDLVEKNQLTTAILQSLVDIQRQINSGHQLTEAEGSRKISHKKNEKFNPRKKGFKPSHLLKQRRQPSQAVIEPTKIMKENLKEPLKCWGYGGFHCTKIVHL